MMRSAGRFGRSLWLVLWLPMVAACAPGASLQNAWNTAATGHNTDLDVSQLPKVTPDSNIMLTLVSSQQKTAFTINGVQVATGKIVHVLVPDRPLTIKAKPEGYIEKEDYLQPGSFRDNSQIGFYFLIEEQEGRLAQAPAPSSGQPTQVTVLERHDTTVVPKIVINNIMPTSGPTPPSTRQSTVSQSESPAAPQQVQPDTSPPRPAVPPTPAASPQAGGPAPVLLPPVGGGRRVALVIGNSNYKYVPPLTNPRNDANLMAETLRKLGFTLIGGSAQIDLDKPAFDRAIQEFGGQLGGSTAALFYYAGHGIQVQDKNYLIPVSANPTKESDAEFQLVNAQLVLNEMEDGGARMNMMILDACRNNPFGGRGLRSATGGLAQMQAPKGTLISYATQPGLTARDGAGQDSPYTTALVQAVQKPGMNVLDVFNNVGLLVEQETGDAQQPWIASSPIEGAFYFASGPS
jgi:hypothetical protein